MPTPNDIAIGSSDFRYIRTQGAIYIDKTVFIQRFLESRSQVSLFCRPRRFEQTSRCRT